MHHILHLPRLRDPPEETRNSPKGGKNRRCCHQRSDSPPGPRFCLLPRFHPVQPDSISPAGHSCRSRGKRGEGRSARCRPPGEGTYCTLQLRCFSGNELIIYPANGQTDSVRCSLQATIVPARREQACLLLSRIPGPRTGCMIRGLPPTNGRVALGFSTCAWLCQSYARVSRGNLPLFC